MDKHYEYILIGGMAAAFAAQNIRELDAEGNILLVGDEAHPPYDRPPLSKQMLADDSYTPDDAYSKYDDFYPKNRVELRRAVRVEKVDRTAKTMSLSDGHTFAYSKLLLATGARARPLAVPGADRPGVFLLRHIEDSLAIRQALQNSHRCVIVGAGYLGMEVAADALTRGLYVTIVEPKAHPWPRFASESLGQFVRKYYEGKGGHFLFGTEAVAFEGEGDHGPVHSVRTSDGQELPADFVVVAAGAELNLNLPQAMGLEVDPEQGVRVNEFLQTSDPSVWAAGDIACFQDIAMKKTWHAEHHLNAKWQGQAVGKIMAGSTEPYDKVPYFFSDFLDLHMILRGDPAGGTQTITVGDKAAAEFTDLTCNDEGVLRLAVGIHHDEKTLDALSDTLETLIRAGVVLKGREAEIQAPGFDLSSLA